MEGRERQRQRGRRTEGEGPLTVVSKQDGRALPAQSDDDSEGQTIMSVLLLGRSLLLQRDFPLAQQITHSSGAAEGQIQHC